MRALLDKPPSPLAAWAHLAVLWSFALAKPLLDILADSPEFFVARRKPSVARLDLAKEYGMRSIYGGFAPHQPGRR